MMPNSRISLSVVAFVSAILLVWMLVSLGALEAIEFATVSLIKLVYFIFVFVGYVYFWIYFYRRPRGSKTYVDGRAALSVSAFIVGVATGYTLIDFGFLIPLNISELAPGSFAIFVAATVLPVMAWLVVFINTRCRMNLARRTSLES